MYEKVIKYVDYNGTEREESFLFNLSRAELTEMEMSTPGGLQHKIHKLTEDRNSKEIFKFFKELIGNSYGEKSEDGRRFVKSEEKTNSFYQTEAYSVLLLELASNADAAAEFFNGIVK